MRGVETRWARVTAFVGALVALVALGVAFACGCGALLGVDDVTYAPGDGGATTDATTAADGAPLDGAPLDGSSPDAAPPGAAPCGHLYVVGGTPTGESADGVTDVLIAPIACDGSLGTWTTSVPALLDAVSYGAGGIVGTDFVMFGGYHPTGTAPLYFAPLGDGGAPTSWSTVDVPSNHRWRTSGAVANDRLFAVGGLFMVGPATNAVTAVSVDGGVAAVTDAGALPIAAIERPAVAVSKTLLFVVGGFPQSSDIRVADLPGDGTVTGWRVAGQAQYQAGYMAAVTYGNHLMVFGGEQHNDVTMASFDGAGMITGWARFASLPGARRGIMAVVFRDHVYVLGGFDDLTINNMTAASEVWIGDLDGAGLKGELYRAPSLPHPCAHGIAAAYAR